MKNELLSNSFITWICFKKSQGTLKFKKRMKNIITIILASIFIFSCKQKTREPESPYGKIGTAKALQKAIKESEISDQQDFDPIRPNISELEAEINNGGFHQYFFNSSGQNCFETLRALEEKNDEYSKQLADLLRKAIDVVNVDKLPNDILIDKIRKRELESLENDSIIDALYSLDRTYYGN
ncbi:DMP19 family protein [Ulvibacterium marinum]|nr:DUF4375 domain-containing protein [Ulvibacterium marinum]